MLAFVSKTPPHSLTQSLQNELAVWTNLKVMEIYLCLYSSEIKGAPSPRGAPLPEEVNSGSSLLCKPPALRATEQPRIHLT